MTHKKRKVLFFISVVVTAITLIGLTLWYTAHSPLYEPVESTISTTTTVTSIIPTTTSSTVSTVETATTGVRTEKTLLSVPLLCQYPSYPTGCEVTAAVMALRYADENVTIESFIQNHLPCSRDFYHYDGKFYGPSPYQYFLGDPRSKQSYGCMAPVIEQAMMQFLGSPKRVVNVTGTDLETLCHRYIDAGTPVIFWASIGMSPILQGRQWTLPDGTLYTWPSGEHCLLLVGYDNDHYYCNDPTTGKRTAYDRQITEQRYATMGKQALVVLPK